MALQVSIAHRVLAISEIMEDIICDERISFLDTLNLGLTCHALLETTLDSLWAYATLMEIARVLPAHVLIWSKSQDTDEESVVRRANSVNEFGQSLKRPADDFTDADELRAGATGYYGHRIHELYVSAEDLDLLGERLIGRLILWNKEIVLLPNLRRIDWCMNAASFSCLHIFLQPGLISVSLGVSSDLHTQMLMDILDHLRVRCPELQELELMKRLEPGNDEGPDPTPFALFMEHWCTYALSVKDLKVFTIRGHTVSIAVLKHLAVLSRLESIGLDNCLGSLSDLVGAQNALFPVLRSINARCKDPQRVPLILANIESRTMHSIHISAKDCAPYQASTLLNIFQTIAASCAALRILSLTCFTRIQGPLVSNLEDDYIVTLDTLLPLLQLRFLSRVTIEVGVVIADDRMLAAIANSCPELSTLQLSCTHWHVRQIFEGTSAVTLGGIEVLMASCRRLINLRVTLDTLSARTWVPNGSLMHTSFELDLKAFFNPKINFEHSKVLSADVETLAVALVQIFPTPWSLDVNHTLGHGYLLAHEAQQHGLEVPAFSAELENRKQSWDQVATRMEELQRAK